MPLYDNFSINELEEKINVIPGLKGATLKTKLNSTLFKDKHLNVLRKINIVLLGNLLLDIYQDPMILSCFKYSGTSINHLSIIRVHD